MTTYKRSSMPLYGENILNFSFKVLLGGIFFWILFYPYYADEMELITRISYIMLFSLEASLLALFTSFCIIFLVDRAIKRPQKGLFDLNNFPGPSSLLYECIAVFLNALFVATGMMLLISDTSNSWIQFLILYMIVKIFTRLIAYVLTAVIAKNIILVIAFITAFLSLLIFAINQIWGVNINV